MSDTRKVPTLSTDNFVSEPILKLDTLYAYFLASEYSQSNIYRGNISSMKYLIQENSGKENKLVANIINQLTLYLERYFDTVNVYAEVNENGIVDVSAEVTDSDGVTANLNSSLNVVNGKLDTYSAIQDMLIN